MVLGRNNIKDTEIIPEMKKEKNLENKEMQTDLETPIEITDMKPLKRR